MDNTSKTGHLDFVYARQLLQQLWREVERESRRELEPSIHKLIESQFVAIRYCLPTQLLGKLVNPNLDCLCLQKGSSRSDSQWDPRSFWKTVIVPWSNDNHGVLGSSVDPYT